MSLHKEPSFSVFNDPFSEVREESEAKGESIEREFSFAKKGMGLIEEEREDDTDLGLDPLCLAAGIGIGEDAFLEEEDHCKKMVEQCPFHPLLLKKYAQILQSKGDLVGAEEYYSRASLADPNDGEMWMEYAKLTWNLHADRDRVSSYFKLATKVAPNHSNILAAYASFLWEIEEEDDHPLTEAVDAFDSMTHVSENPDDLEDHYKKIISQDPNNPLILQNYAKFLYEIRRDHEGAESYYSRAVVADPKDGELTARYAKLVWELHRDHHKASVFFERAVQASFDNSNVLAAYARFLWETEDDEDDTVQNSSSGEQKHANV